MLCPKTPRKTRWSTGPMTASNLPTELVSQLRLVRPKAKFEYAKDQFLMIGQVMREAADEIQRLTFIQKDFHNLEDVAEIKRLTAFIESEFFKRVTYKQENDTLRERVAWFENYTKACDNEIKRADERKRRWELEPPHCSTCSCEALPAQMLKPPDVSSNQDGRQSDEPSSSGGFGTTAEAPSSPQSSGTRR